MRFSHIDINFDITYDGNKKPSKRHRKYFWTILVTFIFDIKLDINICKPYYVNLLFLGGLSLHLNHLIQSRMEISHQLFGTLPIGLLLSNLDSRQLETSPMTSYDQFWNMSTFGDSRAIRVICQKKMPSENRFFLDEGAMRLQWDMGVLGGQVPRLYGGTIFGGGATHLGHPAGHLVQKFCFLDTFAAA